MRAGTHVEVVVGPGNLQFLEEHGAQAGIVMLAGVNDRVRPAGAGFDRRADDRQFHELRPGAHDRADVHYA